MFLGVLSNGVILNIHFSFLASSSIQFSVLFLNLYTVYLYTKQYMERKLIHPFVLFFFFCCFFLFSFLFLITAALYLNSPRTVHVLSMKGRMKVMEFQTWRKQCVAIYFNHPPCLSAAIMKDKSGCWALAPLANMSPFIIYNLLQLCLNNKYPHN